MNGRYLRRVAGTVSYTSGETRAHGGGAAERLRDQAWRAKPRRFRRRAAAGEISALDLLSEDHGNIAPSAIYDAVMTLPLFGSPQTDAGLIENFDVLITWHPHQYHDRISFECICQAMARFGDEGRLAIEPLLEEAGHSTDTAILPRADLRMPSTDVSVLQGMVR